MLANLYLILASILLILVYLVINGYVANAILESDIHTPLKGVAIGNGWMDPAHQYSSFLPFILQSGLLTEDSQVSFET